MAARYIVRRKNFWLVNLEIIGTSGLTAYWMSKRFEWDWVMGLVLFLGIFLLVSFLFYRVTLFRYVFAIIFSLGWGFLAYSFALTASVSSLSHWAAFFCATLLSVLVHRRIFELVKTGRTVDYVRYRE